MANYYRVSPKYWLFARRHGWTDSQTELGIYLLTCDHRNLEGLYRLPKPYIAADLGWPAKKVEENLTVVLASGFAVYDDDAEMVLIPKALKHQAPNTENQIKGAVAQLERIPRTCLWDAFRMACASHCPRLSNAIAERWPSHTEATSHTRAGSHVRSSSSISSSTSTPPQPPEQARGEQGVQESASPIRANSRLLGTNPRNRDLAAAAAQRAAAATVAMDCLAEPSSEQRAKWERLRDSMRRSIGDESSMWALYAEALDLRAVDGDMLVIDGPDASWGWHRAPRLVEMCADSLGVQARMANADEHDGFAVAA